MPNARMNFGSAKKRQKRSKFIYSCAFALFCISPTAPTLNASSLNTARHISTWGADSNDPIWNQNLLVDGSRIGCSAPPAACLANISRLESLPGISHIAIAFVLSADSAADYAERFSELSRVHVKLDAISIDDFLAQYGRSFFFHRADRLRRVIASAKLANPQLAFGITLYTEELNSPLLRYPNLPDDVRNAVDCVYLYVANREDGTNFSRDLSTTKHLFPHAKIVGGVYALDRIDYVPCANHGHRACTEQEEISFFDRTLAIQIDLIRSGDLFGLEFYPGYFGREDQWQGWVDARICKTARRLACLRNTKAMRVMARQAILRADWH